MESQQGVCRRGSWLCAAGSGVGDKPARSPWEAPPAEPDRTSSKRSRFKAGRQESRDTLAANHVGHYSIGDAPTAAPQLPNPKVWVAVLSRNGAELAEQEIAPRGDRRSRDLSNFPHDPGV